MRAHLDTLPIRRSRRSPFANVVLAAAFCGAAVGAYQVYLAKCAQDHTVFEARRTYAHYAAFTFAREAADVWEDALRAAFAGVALAEAKPAPVTAVTRGLRSAPVVPPLLFAFRLDGAGMTVAACDSMPSRGLRTWVTGQVTARRTPHAPTGWAPHTITARRGAQRLLVAYQETPTGVYGFVADLQDASEALAAAVVARRLLLPPRDAAWGTEEALALSLHEESGRALYATAGRPVRSTVVAMPLPGDLAALHVSAGLRPRFAMAVAQPGWTWNRAQFTYVVITLTAGLIVVALLQLRRERAAAQLRADFVANVSHELRTPLAQIRMFAEMLRIGWIRSEDERRRSIQIIDQEARRLTHLVENILQFSRAERRAPKIAPERLELAPFVADVVEGFALLADARQARVRTEVSEGLETIADRDALRQVLLNLLDNAVKYGPPGQTVTVGACAAPARAGRRATAPRVQLWVDDEGPGIPARDRGRVWEPFRRLARPIDGEVTGNGIGLSVVRDLVRVHGGEARIEAAPGGGARVVLELPAADCGLRAADQGVPAPTRSVPRVFESAVRSPQSAVETTV